MKISKKLIIILSLFIILSIIMISSFMQVVFSYRNLKHKDLEYSKYNNLLTNITKNIDNISNLTSNILLDTNHYTIQEYNQNIASLKESCMNKINEIKSNITKDIVDASKINNFELSLNSYFRFNSDIINNYTNNNLENAKNVFLLQNQQYVDNIYSNKESISNNLNFDSSQIINSFENKLTSYQIIYIISFILFILIIIIIAYRMSTEIIIPIKKIQNTIENLSAGNFNHEIECETKNEIGNLANQTNIFIKKIKSISYEIISYLNNISKGNLNIETKEDYSGDFIYIKKATKKIISSLNATINSINKSADQVSIVAKQVAVGAQSSSKCTTQQSISIKELSKSLSEVYIQTKENANNAKIVNSLVLATTDNAKKGSEQMNRMLLSMDQINKTSENIAKFIKVINDIAFQTNILALNASVEAARAGSAGKGFGVVADEVRNLAARSAESAKETTEYIESAINTVREGTEIANHTASALEDIIEGIKNVTDLIIDINTSSNSQADGLSKITLELKKLSELIHDNAISSEQNAVSSEQLLTQADILNKVVSKFKFKQDENKNSKEKDKIE